MYELSGVFMAYLICGSIVMDNILEHNGSFKDSILPEKISNLNVSFDLTSVRQEKGGTGANILYNALQIPNSNSMRPYIFTNVGSDYHQHYNDHFPIENTKYLQHFADKKMASCFILNSNDGNQITSFHQGAMANAVDLSKFPVNQFEHFLFSPDNPANTIALSNICIASSKRFYFDPGQCTPIFIKHFPQEVKQVLKNMHGLFVNEYEKDLLENFLTHPIEDIYNYNSNLNFIVVTKGSKGFEIFSREGNPTYGPCLNDVKVVDPTGCGDSFRAGFMKDYIVSGSAYFGCMKGSIMASFAIEEYGGQNHQISPTSYKEREDKYMKQFSEFMLGLTSPTLKKKNKQP